ncbi:MAG: protein translocase subunit SecF [Candidatus Paceibacterota bacterium]
MIDFLRFNKLYFFISSLVIGIGLYGVLAYGLVFSIDFTGGTALEYKLSGRVEESVIRTAFKEEKAKISTLEISENKLTLRSTPIDEKQEGRIRAILEKSSKDVSVTQLRFETVGPSIGKETVEKTLIASAVAVLGILLYMTFAFKRLKTGLAAVAAMLHDFLVLAGTYVLLTHFFDAEIDTLFITAVLTTMSFSVHDTIVVFDKIREYQRISSAPLSRLANKALTETMVRSINNSLTIALMLVPLVLFGGETIRFFAAALLIGTITGTYSSPFVATPLFVFLEKERN